MYAWISTSIYNRAPPVQWPQWSLHFLVLRWRSFNPAKPAATTHASTNTPLSAPLPPQHWGTLNSQHSHHGTSAHWILLIGCQMYLAPLGKITCNSIYLEVVLTLSKIFLSQQITHLCMGWKLFYNSALVPQNNFVTGPLLYFEGFLVISQYSETVLSS